jgi:outer membrane protein insertion porin family
MRKQLFYVSVSKSPMSPVLQEVEGHVAFPLGFAGAALGFGATAGFLLPLGVSNVNRPTSISDRFFLGGPNSLRGFKQRGVGPSESRRILEEPKPDGPALPRDALGGDFMVSLPPAISRFTSKQASFEGRV